MTLLPQDDLRVAFTSICEQFKKSFNQGNPEGLAALYDGNAKILPPNMDIIEGKDVIQNFWKGALEMGIQSYEPEAIEIEFSGDLGFVVGKYTVCGKENKVLDKGKYISILKKIDGKWLIFRDIYNSSIPLEEN